MENRIPKKIHYCWFGGKPLPEAAKKCIDSWKKYCPDYEIIEWNENNFNIDCCKYAREAYEAKKWAFVSDVARLYALVNYGGIYMDTDVEVLKPLDSLLAYEAVAGFETEKTIATSILGARADSDIFKSLLDGYNSWVFQRDDGSYDLSTNVTRLTEYCSKHGLIGNNTFQIVNGLTLLPKDYLCPKDYETEEINITSNTLVIHHFDSSWYGEEEILFKNIVNRHKKVFSNQIMRYFCKFYCLTKVYGLKKSYVFFKGWIKRTI